MRPKQASSLHHFLQQRRPPIDPFLPKGQDILPHLAGFIVEPEDLLRAREGRLAGAEFQRRAILIRHQLVSHIQPRPVLRNPHPGSHAEGIDGRPGPHQLIDAVFIQAPTGQDPNLRQPGLVQDPAHLAAQGEQIPAVQADADQAPAFLFHLQRHSRRPPGPFQGVVGVDQEDRALGEGLGEGPEGFLLAGEGHDERVGHGSGDRDPIELAGEDIAGGLESDHISATGHLQAGIDPMGPAQGEIHHPPPPRRDDAAGGLGGDHRLKVNLIDHIGLGDLGLDDRRGDLQDGLIGEHQRPFRNRPHLPGEAEGRQVIQEGAGEDPGGLQVGQGLRREAEILQKTKHVFQPGGHQESAFRGEIAHEQAERGLTRDAMGPVGLGHGQLIKVRDQDAVFRLHHRRLRSPKQGSFHFSERRIRAIATPAETPGARLQSPASPAALRGPRGERGCPD
ncbi:hypothetical protein HRbin22_02605 [Candidatus Thermoflexus japonica]|uniref:Uncharacterized protein n=1 Tax=Candidatus Thermoflexus japonica TaxID=2035417 RepID=A0A2H5YAB4_9CHLR|nr:hypothetical protein HRbin22_02605 [Candidatus Thermoflexus japonica]